LILRYKGPNIAGLSVTTAGRSHAPSDEHPITQLKLRLPVEQLCSRTIRDECVNPFPIGMQDYQPSDGEYFIGSSSVCPAESIRDALTEAAE
jgi:hypothetical protein